MKFFMRTTNPLITDCKVVEEKMNIVNILVDIYSIHPSGFVIPVSGKFEILKRDGKILEIYAIVICFFHSET